MTEYTPVVGSAVASAYPTLRPSLATLSRDTPVQLSAARDAVSPDSPVKSSTMSVLIDLAGSVV